MPEIAVTILAAVALGWLVAITSGALFAYIVFRTKRESHESFMAAKPRKRTGVVTRDEFASDSWVEDDDEGLPDVIKAMNTRMGAELAVSGLKGGRKDG